LLEPLLADTLSREVYFVHSFMGVVQNREHLLASVDYNGIEICAAVRKGNVFGTQFHPQKSAETGLAMLRHFINTAN
jgi:glutamine amidotransferase